MTVGERAPMVGERITVLRATGSGVMHGRISLLVGKLWVLWSDRNGTSGAAVNRADEGILWLRGAWFFLRSREVKAMQAAAVLVSR